MTANKRLCFLGFACLWLYGCNSENDSKTLAEKLNFDPATQTVENDISPSVFISAIDLSGLNEADIKSISFTIEPKVGAFSRAVSATYKKEYLSRSNLYDPASSKIQIPVFGLYSNYENTLAIDISFIDNSVYSFQKSISTQRYIDNVGIYDNPSIAIRPTSTPSFSYFYLKGALKSPIIMDIDGEVRWDMNINRVSSPTIFRNNMFIIGDTKSKKIDSLSLYGVQKSVNLNGTSMGSDAYFHHNIDPG